MDFLIISPTPFLLYMATNIALNAGITVYDAVYIALGLYFNTKVITADRELYEKSKKDYKTILLSEY